MKNSIDKKPNKSETFRKKIKDICSCISQDIENTAERRYIQRKYKDIIMDYRERTRRIKNICKRSRKKSARKKGRLKNEYETLQTIYTIKKKYDSFRLCRNNKKDT